MAVKAIYGPGGSLVFDTVWPGVTQELDGVTAEYYGGPHFFGESMTVGAARVVANMIGAELTERERPCLRIPEAMTDEEISDRYAEWKKRHGDMEASAPPAGDSVASDAQEKPSPD